MRTPITLFILAIALTIVAVCSGCQATTYRRDGDSVEIRTISILTKRNLASLEMDGERLTLKGSSGAPDRDAVAAMAEGAVKGMKAP